MIRHLPLFIFLLTVTVGKAQRQVTLTAEVGPCPGKKVQLFSFTGFGFEPLVPLTEQAGGRRTVTLTLAEPTLKYLGTSGDDALPIIIGADDSLTIVGDCVTLRQATIGSESPINEAYADMKRQFDNFNERYGTLVQDIEVIQDARVNREGRQAMQALDLEKRALVDRLTDDYPLLGRIASLNTYLSYYSADSSAYTSQLEHYVNTYFQLVDFSDPGYDELSWTYEAGRAYASNLAKALPGDELADLLLLQTDKWPAGSRARFLARAGVLAPLLPLQHPATIAIADRLVAEYEEIYPGPIAFVKQQTAGLRSFAIGAPAPLFTGATPEGGELALESLRGKVVLLDFWASWCGPCRRENPNVVRMYERFKDRGFEILGVSLDDKRDRWEQAIADDKLSWLHVSDLRGWQSAHGQLYGITSIPQTVLLDREGNILARNLRGPDLERKLEAVLDGKPNK